MDNAEHLIQWLESIDGTDVNSAALIIKPSSFPGVGDGVFAGQAVPPGGLVARIPASIILSADSVEKIEPFRSELHAAWLIAAKKEHDAEDIDMPPLLKLMLYMIYAKHRAEAKHHVYMRSCPSKVDTPFTWTLEELSWLQGTSLYKSVGRERPQAWQDYCYYVQPLTEADASAFPPDIFTFHELLWAHATITSRSLPAALLGSEVEQSDCDAIDCVLCPLLDMFNHEFNSHLEWLGVGETSDESVEFRVPQNAPGIKAGTEIWMSYGCQTNEQLLMNYGFCTLANNFDAVELLLRASGPSQQILTCCSMVDHMQLPVISRNDNTILLGPFSLKFDDGGAGRVELPADLVLASQLCTCTCEAISNELLLRLKKSMVVALQNLVQKLPSPPCVMDTADGQVNSQRLQSACIYLQGQNILISGAITAVERISCSDLKSVDELKPPGFEDQLRDPLDICFDYWADDYDDSVPCGALEKNFVM